MAKQLEVMFLTLESKALPLGVLPFLYLAIVFALKIQSFINCALLKNFASKFYNILEWNEWQSKSCKSR